MTWSYGEYAYASKLIAKALIHLGVEQFDTVGIYAGNRPEWFFAALGTINPTVFS